MIRDEFFDKSSCTIHINAHILSWYNHSHYLCLFFSSRLSALTQYNPPDRYTLTAAKKPIPTDISSLYGGFGVSVLGIVVYRALFFTMFDSGANKVLEDNGLSKFWAYAAVTSAVSLACYPLDTARRRQMLDPNLTLVDALLGDGLFAGAAMNVTRNVVIMNVMAFLAEWQ